MNRAFRIVWNESTQTWTAVSEHARGQGKKGSTRLLVASILSVSLLSFGLGSTDTHAAQIILCNEKTSDPGSSIGPSGGVLPIPAGGTPCRGEDAGTSTTFRLSESNSPATYKPNTTRIEGGQDGGLAIIARKAIEFVAHDGAIKQGATTHIGLDAGTDIVLNAGTDIGLDAGTSAYINAKNGLLHLIGTRTTVNARDGLLDLKGNTASLNSRSGVLSLAGIGVSINTEKAGVTTIGSDGSIVLLNQKMTGLVDGLVSETSTEAVNGSQLFTTNANITQVRATADAAQMAAANAESAVTNVGGLVSRAEAAATTAGASATTAQTAATTATGSATRAAGSATTAGTSATAAQTAATTATDSATRAAGSANTAGTAAIAAQTSATDAGSAATRAETAAEQSAKGVAALTENIIAGQIGLVQQDPTTSVVTVAKDATGTLVDIAGSDGVRTLGGLKDGTVADKSTDAVTGSQLNATNENVVKAQANAIQAVTDSGNALASVDRLANGQTGLVRQANPTALITVAKETLGTTVNFTNSQDIVRTLTGIADGLVNATSSDAINGSQLNATNTNVLNVQTDAAKALADSGTALTIADAAKLDAAKAITDSGTALVAAGTAQTTAEAAQTTADGAQTDATKALADSGTALTTADAAKLDAAKAITDSGNALVAAGTAQTTAEAAQSAVSGAQADATKALADSGKALTDSGTALTTADAAKLDATKAIADSGSAIVKADEAKSEVVRNTTAVANLAQQVQSGEVGLVKQEGENGTVTIASGHGGNVINVAGTSGDRRISGVAAGRVEAGSTDVANGGQVYAVKQKVEQLRVSQSSTAVDTLGDGSDAAVVRQGSRAVAVGSNANAQGQAAVAVGSRASANGQGSVAVGNNASASAEGAVAIGQNSQADRANTVSIGSRGAERQITNVASATESTDAVNFGQTMAISRQNSAQAVRESNAYTDSQVSELKSDAFAGTAAAMAMASLPQVTREGAGMVSLSGSTFEGQSAAAVGVSGMSADGRWIYKASGAATTRGHLGASVGVGYQW